MQPNGVSTSGTQMVVGYVNNYMATKRYNNVHQLSRPAPASDIPTPYYSLYLIVYLLADSLQMSPN